MPPIRTRDSELRRQWLGTRIGSPTVHIKVSNAPGGKLKSFHVHESILKEHSPYFKALIDGGFEEANSKAVTLSEGVDNIDAFEAIVEYMYDGDYAERFEKETKRAMSDTGILHANAFLMANRLCMEDLEALSFSKLSKSIELSRTLSGGKWNSINVFRIVDRVYTFTPAPIQGNEVSELDTSTTNTTTSNQAVTSKAHASLASTTLQKKPNYSELIRALVSRFCAWKIKDIRQEERFKEITVKHPDFTIDLILELKEGDPVEEIPIETLP